jgi:hypothetical protein
MATESILLDKDAFARKVFEGDLKTHEINGYIYAGVHEKSGWVLYRTYGPKWMYVYQARRVATQANAGGGAMVIDISPTVLARVLQMQIASAGANHSMAIRSYDEDNAVAGYLASVGSVANPFMVIPSVGVAATASGNIRDTTNLHVAPGMKLTAMTLEAGAQNDTLTTAVTMLLPITAASDGSDVTWSKARSTNEADVTLADSTISAANTMQAVRLP